jgi:cobalt-zinc-cadmium efflux system outer membrane protein
MKFRPGLTDTPPELAYRLSVKGRFSFRLPCRVALLLALIPVSGARADTNAASSVTVLTLQDAKRTAFLHNWDLLAAKSGIDAADAQLIVVREFPNPGLSWTTARIGDHAGVGLGNDVWQRAYDTIFAVNQLIEIGGKRSDRQQAGKAGLLGARARFFDAKRTLDQGVTKAYMAALLAKENVRVLTESARMLRHEADIGKERLKAGDVSESDELQIEMNADLFDLQEKSAEAAAVQARIAVEVLMGVQQPRGGWASADSLDQMAAVVPATPAPKFGAARPDIVAAESDLDASRANLRLQRAERVPDPTFLVQYEHNPGQPPEADTVGIGMSFPLPLWNRNTGNIKAAQAAVDQSEDALGKARTQMLSDVATAQVEYDEAFQRLNRYHEILLPKSAKVRDAVSFAYEHGGAALVDLLEAERSDNANRLAAAQARSDAASAVADLIAAKAVLSETELSEAK